MDRGHKRRNKIKVLITMSLAVLFGAMGDASLSKGMKMVGAIPRADPLTDFMATITNPYVIGGILLLILFLALYLASLSWEDLSYVLPLTGGIYILVTLFAFFFLHEDVTPARWAGSVLVGAGIALVARS